MDSLKKISHYYSRLLKGGQKDPDFFEFVRTIERVTGAHSVGRSSKYATEPVRFGQMPYLQFPETTIAEISENEKLLIFVYFMGLTGVNGPFPLEYTNYAYQRSHNYYDLTIRRFNDIINHRFIGLFYRAWKMNEMAVSLDNPKSGLLVNILNSLAGNPLEHSGLRRDVAMEHSGIFGNTYKSKDGLKVILNEYFHLPIKIVEKCVSQSEIPDEYRCHLGRRGVSELGKTVQLGGRFYTNTRKFLLEVHDVAYSEVEMLLPGARGFDDLLLILEHYLNHPFDYDLKLYLKTESLPKPKLNGKLQMGRNIWLQSNHMERKTVLTIGASRLAESKHRHRL